MSDKIKRDLEATRNALLNSTAKLMTDCSEPSEVTSRAIAKESGVNLAMIKEALIKSGVHDAQSDFSSDCIKTTQAYCRMSRSFCAGWRKICKQNVRQVEDVI